MMNYMDVFPWINGITLTHFAFDLRTLVQAIGYWLDDKLVIRCARVTHILWWCIDSNKDSQSC